MKIALVADPYVPVPPILYGGIERIIDFLLRGLVARGHDVTLIAHPESRAPKLVPYGVPPHSGWRPRALELFQASRALISRRWDVVHSFGRLGALLPLLPLRRLPKIQSYQRDRVHWGHIATAARLGGRSIVFTGCSGSVFRDGTAGEWRCIFNGVEIEKYQFVPSLPSDAPLAFLGRLEAIKGVHHAIAIARKAGRRLVIAGNKVGDYFDREIAPHLDDHIRYLGPVDDAQKNTLLGGASALLMPIEVEEAFGIVMAEALACGTPVIGFARGSVPEVIKDGLTGAVCRTVDEAVAAVGRIASFDRAAARRDCEERFSAARIVDQYQRLYEELRARCGAS